MMILRLCRAEELPNHWVSCTSIVRVTPDPVTELSILSDAVSDRLNLGVSSVSSPHGLSCTIVVMGSKAVSANVTNGVVLWLKHSGRPPYSVNPMEKDIVHDQERSTHIQSARSHYIKTDLQVILGYVCTLQIAGRSGGRSYLSSCWRVFSSC